MTTENEKMKIESVGIEGNETQMLKKLCRYLRVAPISLNGDLCLMSWECRECVHAKITAESCRCEYLSDACAAAFLPNQRNLEEADFVRAVMALQ